MRTLLIFLCLVGFSCAPRDAPSTPSPTDSSVVLNVHNQNWYDVVIFDMGTNSRVGDCVSQDTCRLTLTPRVSTQAAVLGKYVFGLKFIGLPGRINYFVEGAFVEGNWNLVIKNMLPLTTFYPAQLTSN